MNEHIQTTTTEKNNLVVRIGKKITTVPKPLLAFIGVFLTLTFCSTTLGFVSSQSLPGEALYSLKTNVLEKILQIGSISHQSKAAYQIELLKNRLAEVKQLDAQDTISNHAIRDLIHITTVHNTTLTHSIETSIDSAFPKIAVMTTLNEYASVAMAIETLAERNANFGPFGEHMEDMRSDAVNLYKDRVTSFVQTETEVTVLTYMQDSLRDVKTRLQGEKVSKEAIDDAENYLDRVTTSLQAKKLDRAIFSIGEAYRFIQTEAYTGVLTQAETTTEAEVTEVLPSTSSTTEATSTTSSDTAD